MRILRAAIAATLVLAASAQPQGTPREAAYNVVAPERVIDRCGFGTISESPASLEQVREIAPTKRERPAAANECSSVGPQRVAAIIVNFPGGSAPSIRPEDLRGILLGPVSSVDEWYRRTSYGRLSFAGEVYGPYTLDRVYSCSELPQMRAAAVRAADAEVDFREFERYILVFPVIRGCPFGATATLGCSDLATNDGTVSASWVWINDFSSSPLFLELLIHELGHNLGLGHSKLLRFPGESLAADDFRAVPVEYGDLTAAMGTGMGDFAAAHKVQMQWLDRQTDVRDVEEDAEYLLAPLEDSGGLRALRVRRRAGAEEWIWIEQRRGGTGGVIVRRETAGSGASTHLIDMTAATLEESRLDLGVASERQVELGAGSTWPDPHSDLTIEIGEASPDGLPVRVRYDNRCALPAQMELSVSAEEQTVRLPVSETPPCDWHTASGRSWLSVSRLDSDAVITVSALTGKFRRSGNFTVGRTVVKITQNPVQRSPEVQSVSPPSGGMPVDAPFPFLLQIRDENGVQDVRAVQIAIASGSGLPVAPCYFRFAIGSALQVSEDGATFRESEDSDAARSGICALKGSARQYTPTVVGFRGSLQLPGADLEGSVLSVSVRTEDSEGAIGEWLQAAHWTGTRDCMVLPSADWNSYLWSGTTNDSVPITATATPCAWTATTDSDWIRLKVSSSAEGPAPRFDMEENVLPVAREGLLFVNGTPVRLLQRAAVDPNFTTLRPEETLVSSLAGIGMLTFFYGLAELPPVYAESAWLRVLSVERAADRREIRFAFDANPDLTMRTGSILVGGKPFTVLQHPAPESEIP